MLSPDSHGSFILMSIDDMVVMSMEDFEDIAKARAAWSAYVSAMQAGREIMVRAGVAEPPPIPEFDAVFKRLDTTARTELFNALRDKEPPTPAEAIGIWQPLLKRAFGGTRH
jgi:alpha-D-ribose 1-methylphosphonate 5-phosphate C-P lyase